MSLDLLLAIVHRPYGWMLALLLVFLALCGVYLAFYAAAEVVARCLWALRTRRADQVHRAYLHSHTV